MKKIKFEKKLNLKKDTVAKLNDDEMRSVNGGEDFFNTRLWCGSAKCVSAGCTLNQVTCDIVHCPTQGCYSAVYC